MGNIIALMISVTSKQKCVPNVMVDFLLREGAPILLFMVASITLIADTLKKSTRVHAEEDENTELC